jgi:uncharacterized membrane protein YgcG
MELFLPSILVLLIACGIVFAIIPKLSPMIIAVLSLVLLTVATYHHFSLFSSEYRLSTWQDILKTYAPGVFIIVLIIFIIFSIIGFFGGTSVPVPGLPYVPGLPPANTSTNMLTETINNGLRLTGNGGGSGGNGSGGGGNGGGGGGITGAIANTLNTVKNTVSGAVNGVVNGVNNTKNNITRSMLATI